MKTVLITGAAGFIGRNLTACLSGMEDIEVLGFDVEDSLQELENALKRADFVFHLAGVNRPKAQEDYTIGNRDFTAWILDVLKSEKRSAAVLIASSIQAELDNPYGRSKRQAEEIASAWAAETGNEIFIYRLPNVFGKWCKPNYNSVVATFCHNIANGLPVQINDPSFELKLVYIDDVVKEFIRALEGKANRGEDCFCCIERIFTITLQSLADTLYSFGKCRQDLVMPDFSQDLIRYLYATYISYLPEDGLGCHPGIKSDRRGWLTEFVKSEPMGQIFISVTKPGITRGNHWHHTKTEKFLVLQGNAVIRLRQIHGNKVLEYPVSGEELNVIDIPPGYVHSITNTGDTNIITLFWSSEIFNPEDPDTIPLEV